MERVGYVWVCVAGALGTLAVTPIVVFLSNKIGWTDRPGVRKVHTSAVPRVGGIAILLPLLAVFCAVLLVDPVALKAFLQEPAPVLVILGISIGMALVGLADDAFGLRARYKLLLQLVAAIAFCAFGYRIQDIAITDSFALHLGYLSWPLTVMWIIGVTNAMNLIDGLDGLATGIATIVCGVILVLGLYSGQLMMTLLALVLLGNLSGFLYFNSFPAKVFLGDGGSLFLGFFLAVSSVYFTARSGTGSVLGLVLPGLALGLPISDALFAIVRRIIERRPIFAPDRSHIHHRLLDKRYSHPKVVVLMHTATLLSAFIGLCLLLVGGFQAIFVFALALVPMAIIFRMSGLGFWDLVAKFKRSRKVSRIAKKDLESFLKLQLRLREAKNPAEWWLVMRRAARFMSFSAASVQIERPDRSVLLLHWRNPRKSMNMSNSLVATLAAYPVNKHQILHVEVDISTEEGLESAGRRLSLFGRLLEDHQTSTHRPISIEFGRGLRPLPAEVSPSSNSF